MPLSTVCVSTVTSRPRAWSSYSNIRAKDVQLKSMNSAEEIYKYKEPNDNCYSPTLSRRLLGYGYDLPEKSPKKEKKWSISSLFRKKKKEESETSSDEDPKKGFLGRKKRKSDKKRKPKTVGTFDHVVIPRNLNGYNREEGGIFSDPSGGFNSYVGRALPKVTQENKNSMKISRESLDDLNNSRVSIGSADSARKSRKGLAKVRAEVRRSNLKLDSSSDEDSQRSASSSRLRSDESLTREGSFSRRSRAARTERYLRRQSKDGEKDFPRSSKSDVENSYLNWKLSDDSNRSLSRSPLVPAKLKTKTSYSSLSSQSPSISGLSTIPPSHASHSKIRVSNSTSNPSYKPPLSMNDYNYGSRKLPYDNYLNNQRSISCDSNIHKAASSEMGPGIIHAQLPLGKPTYRQRSVTMIDPFQVSSAQSRQPPPPPPRDPKRLVTAQFYDNGRPTTYYFDNTGQMRSKSFHTSQPKHQMLQTKKYSFNLLPSARSTSEDYLSHNSNIQLTPRPSSTTPEANLAKNPDAKRDNYSYLTDKKPRSRRPIFITNSTNANSNEKSEAKKALEFWKQKDKEGSIYYFQEKAKARKSNSPQMFTSQTHVQTQVFLPSVLQNDINSDNLANSTDSLTVNDAIRPPSPFKTISPKLVTKPDQSSLDDDDREEIKRKSSNLEEALDELEAIYNSLRLGDEDLLERAEQREKDAAAQKLKDSNYTIWGGSRGTLSDSSFSYEPFDSVDSPRRKRLSRRSQTIDRRADDMAYRKLNKERSTTINDPQSVISKLSYLQTSPVYGKEIVSDFEVYNKKCKEPDVTLDDVVYRNVKYANNNPKVVEPQPPFGIPIGPIALAANSDYLHAVPDDIPRPSFKPRKIPDVVKDDLAFRNLRKDSSKEPALPPLSPDDLKNNNSVEPARFDLNNLKKKRAVRSLSANIGSLINKDVLARGLEKHKNNNVENEFRTLTDIADAMEIARQVLKEKEDKINNTRRAFLSDTDTNNVDNGNSYGKLTESRLNFLNSLNSPVLQRKDNCSTDYLHSKPPRGLTPDRKSPRSPKESTPIPLSPLEEKSRNQPELRNPSFDDLLTALATEARETSERITKELEEFEDGPSEVDKQLFDIDAVSERAKLCKKLLEGVVDSTAMTPVEEVEQIEPIAAESLANIVLTREDSKEEKVPDVAPESDHDYENLISDKELNIDENVEKCTSPFEEHKAELIASFQELKKNVDLDIEELVRNKAGEADGSKVNDDRNGVAGKHSPRRSRSRLPRWLRPHSCGSLSDPSATMSEGQETRAERIARYKEERRRQLAVQFDVHSDPSKKKNKDSSGSEGPRATRASRLRAAVSTQENGPNPAQATDATERLPTPAEEQTATKRGERDKSSKRKSNLNRALNCEEVPNCDSSDDVKARRRRRRFFPSEVLNQPIKEISSNDERVKSDASLTASTLSQSSLSQVASPKTPSRRSELSIHMENARKGIAPSYSEMGKFRALTKRPATSSPKPSKSSTSDNSHSDRDASKDATRRKPSHLEKSTTLKNKSNSDNDVVRLTRNTAKRMEELTALTKETLARVEKLATKAKESPKVTKKPLGSSPVKQVNDSKRNLPFSILKKKSIEEPILETVPNLAPVSILKRKVSQEDHVRSEGASSTHTPPVTFSPSVVEPATTNRKQGILKKRRSLDESQVMRHRSCSPDVANKAADSRSILKNQRRSSLEELRRIQSPEAQLHSILKRKTSRNEEDDHSLNSPQGILKRRSGASSAGSTGSTPHVSITTAVILAAAGGAEMILESDAVKPILKKKSFSEEHSYYSESNHSETPRPILKKKSSTDTDDCDDRPKRPILKLSRNSIDRDSDSGEGRSFSSLKHMASENECDVKTILRQNCEAAALKPRLSFCNERNGGDDNETVRRSRRSNTICSDFSVNSRLEGKEEDRDLRKPRPLSVFDLVMSFESSTSTGAIPKKSSMKRNSDRYKTQPVTSNELEASLNLVRIPQLPKVRSPDSNFLLNFTSSLENDSDLNGFLSSFHNTSPDSGVCGKMSSDSAFQSLGDGLELDQDDASPEVSIKPHKLEPSKLEMQMKAIAEEAKNKKLGKGNAGVQKYRNRRSTAAESSRFSTQPVTFDEVQEAARINKNSEDSGDEADPSNLSLFERIKLFNVKVDENRAQKRDVPRRRINRFQTQPVTSDEVNTARCIPPTQALDDDCDRFSGERRGILKSNSSASRRSGDSSPSLPKSALKKRDSFTRFSSKTEISDITYDEGISCNDSGSDSEIASVSFTPKNVDDKTATRSENRRLGKSNSDTTSDGESSGGREVRSIFKNDHKLKVKQALESVLSKSRSQGVVGDEIESTNRKTTSSILRRSQTHSAMPRTIAELQAKLQQSGESGWKKRAQQNNDEISFLKDKNKYNDELSEKSILALKKDELDASAKQWKSRVEKPDAEKFSVAGRMDKSKDGSALPINIQPVDKNKRTPQAKRFKGREGSDSSSTPVSPDKSRHLELTRSYSVPDPDQTRPGAEATAKFSGRTVLVSRPDDFTFKNFYKSIEETSITSQRLDVSLDDFDAVTRHSLLVQKKNIQVQRRRGASKNPIKALASRTDISDEYTEVITGVAEREKKRLNIEKLAKNSNLAVEALAGLASKEDFTAVALKKSSSVSALVPFKDVMLLQVKGRRHVQTRLVEPKVSSINEGDNFILVTGSSLYNYIGAFANIIEQSRALDVVNHIQQTGDLGCKVDEVITVSAKNSSSPTKQVQNFWKLLGSSSTDFTDAGNPTEDEIYESNILSTNMIYKLEDDELVPWDEYWGVIPKIEMLQSTRVIVFDFGSEMYVWSGKVASLDKKKRALKLAKELWDEGYNYSECSICPLNVASILGDRPAEKVEVKSSNRPNWALFAKITQHRETILFKEKFLDWPDFSRVIRIKGDETDKSVDPSYDIQPCNVEEMLKQNKSEPDLVVEGHHLGRGASYFDEETKRLFEFDTVDITAWRILENHSEKLGDSSVSHFYDGDSYIIRWNYRMTVKGRDLSGKPSKHAQAGRNRCIYFCWQGSNASINEKGYAALLTVELDNEKAPQIRVVQGSEPAAFLRLFNGSMVVHKGKRDDPENFEKPRLFMIKGEVESEVSLIEVPCELKQLRSRTCFILVDSEEMFIWYGAKSSNQSKKVAKRVADGIMKQKSVEFSLDDEVEIIEVEEGEEPREFFDIIGNEANSYFSLLGKNFDYDFNIRLFNLSSISGTFKATEVVCPYRSEHSSPYPFLQSELYSASQPALFLIDNHHELWLWQGWWPETEENVELSDQTGSGAVRWQVERKVAMQTAVDYWKKSHSGDESVPAYLVWAGLEPLEFKNLFSNWVEREDVAELNLMEGRKRDAKLSVEKQLALLSRTTYPLAELLQRPLPEGVDPTHLEIYLSPEDFHELLSMTKEEFQKLPMWKQTAMKKEKGLF